MPDDANGSTELLIGRAAELTALDRTIRSVTQGSSAVLLMTGDAGIGVPALAANGTLGSSRAAAPSLYVLPADFDTSPS